MEKIYINSSSIYPVYISNDFSNFYNIFQNKKNYSKVFIITDENVYRHHDIIINGIKKVLKAKVFIMEPGEQNKTINTINHIYEFIIENGGNRNSVIIALGGGIVGDISGFVAATYMRGIDFINIPTTIVSQTDSCIGGKVGYNCNRLKNLVGTFYNPKLVFLSPSFLSTLPKKIYNDGLGEIIKYSLLDKEIYDFILLNYSYLEEYNYDKLVYIIRKCISFKEKIVKEDYTDLGLRNVLNLGHTVGHAIEYVSDYNISHGTAVALGLLVAIKLSEEKLNFPKYIYNSLIQIYKKLNLPTTYKVDNYRLFLYAINRDKKKEENINFVLLENIGKYKIKVKITESEIVDALKNSIDK